MGRFGGKHWLALASCCAFAGAAQAQSLPVAASPDGHFEIALHARDQRSSARAEQAAWLSVTVPLEKLAAAAPAPAAAKAPEAASVVPPVAPEPTPAPLVSFQQLRALTDFSRRATLVALGVAGTAAERRRLDSLSGRARACALLPELRLRAARNTDQALRLSPTTDDPYRVTQADGAGLVLEASATFRLDRLLFAREELTVERLRQQAGEARLKLELRIQAALLGLFRARQLSCAVEPGDQKTREAVKAVELFAELDNLTAGWFSDQAASFGRAVWGFPEAVLGVCSPPEPASAATDTNPVASLENSE